jgi:hypothetical protein
VPPAPPKPPGASALDVRPPAIVITDALPPLPPLPPAPLGPLLPAAPLPPASPKADAPPQERLLHEKPPGGNNEQLVGGFHATETEELWLPP